MLKQPFLIDLLQAALVAAGRQQLALAVTGDDVEEVTGRDRPVAVELYGEVRDHVPQLGAAFAEPNKADGELADCAPAGIGSDGRAVQRPVFGVRREKAALSSGCKAHPAIAPAGSNRGRHG